MPLLLEQLPDDPSLGLVMVPYQVPFIAVTKRVMRDVAAEHFATLRAAVGRHLLACGLALRLEGERGGGTP